MTMNHYDGGDLYILWIYPSLIRIFILLLEILYGGLNCKDAFLLDVAALGFLGLVGFRSRLGNRFASDTAGNILLRLE